MTATTKIRLLKKINDSGHSSEHKSNILYIHPYYLGHHRYIDNRDKMLILDQNYLVLVYYDNMPFII